MSNTASIKGAKKLTTVSSYAALVTAISNAKPGAVITLDTVVAAFTLTISSPKAAPGVSIVLPAAQPYRLIFNGTGLNTEIIGGTISADAVGASGSSDYSLALNASSFFAVRGARISEGTKLVVGGGATDFEITDCIAEWGRSDAFQLIRCKRFLIDNLYGKDMAVKGQKMLWWANGALPSDGVADSSNGTTSHWTDTSHNDGLQIRNETGQADYTQDFAVTNCELDMLGAGIVSFGQNSTGGAKWGRALIAGNTVRTTDNGAVIAEGFDVEVRDNIIDVHPVGQSGQGTVNITLARRSAAGAATGSVAGGRNITLGATSVVNPTGVTLNHSTQITGDTVNAPALPDLRRPSWFPSYTRPTYSIFASPPVVAVAPQLYWYISGAAHKTDDPDEVSPPAPAVGTWVTAGLGKVKGSGTITYEHRWCRNGVPISGETARIHQIVAGDQGMTLTCEVRATSDLYGVGDWKASAIVAIA